MFLFNEAIDALYLVEIPLKGNFLPTSQAKALTMEPSHHCPCVVNI